jgi:hypothetical protein
MLEIIDLGWLTVAIETDWLSADWKLQIQAALS